MPIHAFDQQETLLGQASVGLELEQQAPGITTLLVAVGGGGLIAGIAAWYQGRIKLVGVEPEQAPTLSRALAAGRPVDAEAGGIAADSLAPRRVGWLPYWFAAATAPPWISSASRAPRLRRPLPAGSIPRTVARESNISELCR
jgi:threonine dehydratase